MISPGRCHLHRGDVTSSDYSTGFVVAKGLAQRDTDRSIKRLRSVQGDRADANESCDFWLELPNDFKEKGGTELAPFSSSADIKVALRYSDKAEKRILLKVATRSFMERGADMQYLSAFPDEAEYLYEWPTLASSSARPILLEVASSATRLGCGAASKQAHRVQGPPPDCALEVSQCCDYSIVSVRRLCPGCLRCLSP